MGKSTYILYNLFYVCCFWSSIQINISELAVPRAKTKYSCERQHSLSIVIMWKPALRRLVEDDKGTLHGNVKQTETKIDLRCRAASETFLFSFEDRDGSVAVAGTALPIGGICSKYELAIFDDAAVVSLPPETTGSHRSSLSTCPCVLSLHGTGVSAQSQADSYKQKISKKQRKKGGKKRSDVGSGAEFLFGIEHAWLVTPSRQGAHNWEHNGRTNALRAVEALHVIASVRYEALRIPPPDVHR